MTMKYLGLIWLIVIVTLGSCEKTSNIDVISLNGTYKGTFQRKIDGSGQISNVTITFSDTNWLGDTQFSKYPALCKGTFSLSDNTINFENSCPWTAEFDWTLILSGKYQVKSYGDTIEISRDLTAYKDVYLLTKDVLK